MAYSRNSLLEDLIDSEGLLDVVLVGILSRGTIDGVEELYPD